jgi:hypothetical protein
MIQKLIKALEHNKYKVTKTTRSQKNHIYDFYEIIGNCIIGGFCTPHDENSIWASYESINGKIAIDHKTCFDKWRKCPLILPLPENEKQIDWLMDRLKFWGSEEGCRISDEYEMELWDTEYKVIK